MEKPRQKRRKRRAGRRLPALGLIQRSDRGSPYASDDDRTELERHGCVASMCPSGDCWYNAVAESFFSTVEFEVLARTDFATRAQTRRTLGQYIAPSWLRRRLQRRGPAPRGEQSGRFAEVEIGEEQPRLAVRLEAEQRAVRTSDRRGGAGALARAIHRSEVAGVLRRATEHRLLVERVAGIGECGRAVASGFGDMRMRVKDDLRTPAGGPPHGLGISPAFMADHHAEG